MNFSWKFDRLSNELLAQKFCTQTNIDYGAFRNIKILKSVLVLESGRLFRNYAQGDDFLSHRLIKKFAEAMTPPPTWQINMGLLAAGIKSLSVLL